MAYDRRREDLAKLGSLMTDHGIAAVAFKNASDKFRQLATDFERQQKVYNKKKLALETIYATMIKKGKELGLLKDEKSSVG